MFSDNDADAWNEQLTDENGVDFDHVTVLKNNAAKEKAIKDALTTMVSGADGGDILAFIFSGKGHYNQSENSWALAAHDATSGDNGEDGDLYDEELATIMGDSIAERVFFFFDCCNASGMSYELAELNNSDTFFLATATAVNQPSFQDEDAHLRCWTQCFLNYAWNGDEPNGYEGSITADFNDIYIAALQGYILYAGTHVPLYDYSIQNPQKWNFYGEGFCLSKEGIL